MTIRARIYYNHFDKNGDVDGDKQLASIALSEKQSDEKGFFMDVHVSALDGRSCSCTIFFHPHCLAVKTDGDMVVRNDHVFFLPVTKDSCDDEDSEEV